MMKKEKVLSLNDSGKPRIKDLLRTIAPKPDGSDWNTNELSHFDIPGTNYKVIACKIGHYSDDENHYTNGWCDSETFMEIPSKNNDGQQFLHDSQGKRYIILVYENCGFAKGWLWRYQGVFSPDYDFDKKCRIYHRIADDLAVPVA
jgi:hypothetical protein